MDKITKYLKEVWAEGMEMMLRICTLFVTTTAIVIMLTPGPTTASLIAADGLWYGIYELLIVSFITIFIIPLLLGLSKRSFESGNPICYFVPLALIIISYFV